MKMRTGRAINIRDFRPEERECVDDVVRAAWRELSATLSGWSELEARLCALTARAAESEVIVAEMETGIVGAAGYVGAHQPKPTFFDPAWPVIRLMSVAPSARGVGVGGRLLEECIARARRDGAEKLALHTTPLMAAAQRLYVRAGFRRLRPAPDMFGAPYVLMVKDLQQAPAEGGAVMPEETVLTRSRDQTSEQF
jgi:GNAT superfamily N-acetyltransferase